jgi:two-component system, chemotaxis family, chemotaxis protein CheY
VPAARKPPPRSDDRRKNPESDSGVHILVVEDDHDFGESLCLLLSAYGYRTTLAVDGVAALELLRDGHLPDIILLDLMLPRLDGWGFREAQLADRRLNKIPVIVLSAVGELARPIDADHQLRKPVFPDELLKTIGKCLA